MALPARSWPATAARDTARGLTPASRRAPTGSVRSFRRRRLTLLNELLTDLLWTSQARLRCGRCDGVVKDAKGLKPMRLPIVAASVGAAVLVGAGGGAGTYAALSD